MTRWPYRQRIPKVSYNGKDRVQALVEADGDWKAVANVSAWPVAVYA